MSQPHPTPLSTPQLFAHKREAWDTWSNLSLWVVAPGIPQQEQEELEISTEAQKGLVHITGEAF